jgi:hypothetical protein
VFGLPVWRRWQRIRQLRLEKKQLRGKWKLWREEFPWGKPPYTADRISFYFPHGLVLCWAWHGASFFYCFWLMHSTHWLLKCSETGFLFQIYFTYVLLCSRCLSIFDSVE